MENSCSKSSKLLLDLEETTTSSASASSLESKLFVCKKDEGLLMPRTAETNQPDRKPNISSLPRSEVLGKVKNFLGVISEANRSLQDNSKDYDIEVLTGNECEYIEMDLMLGVADLNTPEAVAAAESAMSCCQPVIPLAASSSGTESDDEGRSDEDDSSGEEDHVGGTKSKASLPATEDSSSQGQLKCRSKKRPRIVELS